MDWDDLEPIDLEPMDRASDTESRFDRDRPRDRRSTFVWIGVVAVGLGAWATIALTNHGAHDHASPIPAPTSLAAPDTIAPLPPPRIGQLAPRLWDGLRGIGSGRFAVVVDDRLYLLDEASTEAETTLVPLPDGRVTIDDQNGSSLLASTFQQTIVSTVPLATRTLSVRDGAFRAVTPARWWVGRGDGTLRDDRTGAVQNVPPDLRVVAAVQQGFVALDTDSRWVVWSAAATRFGTTSGTRSIAARGGQLLAAGTHAIAIQYPCEGNVCPIDIVDTGNGRSGITNLRRVPQFAAFSPDGTRLALTSADGVVTLLDTTDLRDIVDTTNPHPIVESLPITWTSDSRTLLVVRRNQVDVIRAADGDVTDSVTDTAGLEQLVALP